MKATFRVIVDDPEVKEQYGAYAEDISSENEPFFLDGPVGARIAIVDRNPRTGRLRPPVRWSPGKHKYITPEDNGTDNVGPAIIRPDDIRSPAGIAVSVFGLVLETLAMFEQKDVLGHTLKWALNAPQLLIVPNAGIWKNAFYDRFSSSLQYFSFPDKDGKTIFTALSRDIITHETGHAVLDGIAPALYDALTPQSLALHESIGDLTAIVMSLHSPRVRDWIVKNCDGKLIPGIPVSKIGEQFGRALEMGKELRDADENVTLGDVSDECHDLSRVLTSAFWSCMMQMHNRRLSDQAQQLNRELKKDEKAKILGVSTLIISRMLFRALEYMPPAETSFADYCRAVIRMDEAGFPDDKHGYRDIFKAEFLKRKIVNDAAELDSAPEEEWVQVDLDDIVESEWAAYAFAEKNRKLLKIPPRTPFRLFPRLDVARRFYPGKKPEEEFEDKREVVFQLTWEHLEKNEGNREEADRRAVFRGTTLVLGEETDGQGRHRILSRLTSDSSKTQEKARSRFVRSLADRNQMNTGSKWGSFNSRPLAQKVFGRTSGNVLRLRGTARLIQLAELTND
jgi:hypothetical protein